MERNRVQRKIKRIYSPVKRKVLLLLQAGVALSYAGTLGRQMKILKEAAEEWREIDMRYLRQIVREFYKDRLISEEECSDGTTVITLTERGRVRALAFNVDTLILPKRKSWDGTWHAVLFDIPETRLAARHAFRQKLRDLGFLQWQKSVFIFPHPCRDEIDFVVEFFGLRPYVRLAVLTNITNEEELLLRFGLKPKMLAE